MQCVSLPISEFKRLFLFLLSQKRPFQKSNLLDETTKKSSASQLETKL